jgi:hypothetical protein
MSRFALKVTFAVVFAVAGSACGGDSSTPDPGPSSGVSTSTRLIDLSEADAIALCDWAAARFGGYGHGVTCTNGVTVTARQTRELCLMDYQNASPTCPVTVGEIEACANQSVGPPVCASVPSVCAALLACVP